MGDEIDKVHFDQQDVARFGQHLRSELAELRRWERDDAFAQGPLTTGLELEAWLLEPDGSPAPDNGQFLESLANNAVVPELAKFNFELNVAPQLIVGQGLQQMQNELLQTWQICGERAAQLGRRITCIGVLPTVLSSMLCTKNMTPRSRFAALNEQVVRMRRGQPLRLQIQGIDQLDLVHHDVMLEAAATSLQVHLKVPLAEASTYFNAFVIASAATVAMAANALVAFGKRLWHDSRVPIFEQAVDTGDGRPRVTFGQAYAGRDFLSLFDERVDHYQAILPVELNEPRERVPHLRLHNGTLWFWNRPLIGFEENGQPHVRIEHRVMSAGPTAADMFANIALALGLTQALATHGTASKNQQPLLPEQQCDFATARENFYAAARYGLNAPVRWLGGQYVLHELMHEHWLPMTRSGLIALEVEPSIIELAMDVLGCRCATQQTASAWQLAAFERHAGDVYAILDEYLTNQATRRPVHEWSQCS